MPLVRIIEELCDGCGECIPACHEGALRIIDGKARLVDAAACDGAGACIGECPRGAIVFEEAPAAGPVPEPLPQPPAAPAAAASGPPVTPPGSGCPGAAHRVMAPTAADGLARSASALRQWPIQLHLLSPAAPFLTGSHLLLAADCAAFASGEFHADWLAGHTLAIACPKLDGGQEAYEEKLVAMLRHCSLASLTVLIMEVPCCSGLVRLAERALLRAGVEVPVRVGVLAVGGQVVYDSAEGTQGERAAV